MFYSLIQFLKLRVFLVGKITACIVTFNRKDELLRCLHNVIRQSCSVSNIVIYDNASTDGTAEKVIADFESDISPLPRLQKVASVENINVWLIVAEDNSGGAGGFHESVKLARENFDSEYYWLMDDDGYPDHDCLEKIIHISEVRSLDYVMPVSINIDNHVQLSWPTRMKNGLKTDLYSDLYASWGDVMDYITPFNGSLLTKKCVDLVGYVNKDLFIWGDEYDHYWRCKKNGINPVTVMTAKFYHPALKLPLHSTLFGLIKIPYVDSKLRMTCLVRNYTYIYKKYDSKTKIPIKLLAYSWFFLITRRLDISGLLLYINCVIDGLTNNFKRHYKYINKK